MTDQIEEDSSIDKWNQKEIDVDELVRENTLTLGQFTILPLQKKFDLLFLQQQRIISDLSTLERLHLDLRQEIFPLG